MKIIPVAKCQPETISLLPKEEQKYARQSSQGALPTIFVATNDLTTPFDPENDAALGFKYRRQSHHCELQWVGGTNVEALAELAKVLVMQSILEGRKRVEIFNPYKSELSKYEWPGDTLNSALEYAGFKHEGYYGDWTDFLEPVHAYSYIWLDDGLPVLKPDTSATLVNSGEWTKDEKDRTKGWGVQFYREKNEDLYRKDKDLYRKGKENDDRTFAQHIEDAVDYVMIHEQTKLDNLWHGKERLPEPEMETV